MSSPSGPSVWLDHHAYSVISSLGRFLGKPWSSALTVGVLAVALALPLGLWLVLGNVTRFSGQVQQSREVSVFLAPEVDAARVRCSSKAASCSRWSGTLTAAAMRASSMC